MATTISLHRLKVPVAIIKAAQANSLCYNNKPAKAKVSVATINVSLIYSNFEEYVKIFVAVRSPNPTDEVASPLRYARSFFFKLTLQLGYFRENSIEAFSIRQKMYKICLHVHFFLTV